MRAVVVEQFGGPEVLVVRDRASPAAGPGEVVIAVDIAPVLFLDTLLRSGWGTERFGLRPPYVPGAGVAGTVSAVGEGVPDSWLGVRVVAGTGPSGGYAEQAVAPVTHLVAVPDGVGLPEAAALVNDGRTALSLLQLVAPQPGQHVLVVGAAGGMGALLVQLARTAGAHVIGSARSEDKLALVRELGAEAVDHETPGWTDRVRDLTGGQGVDVVLDGVGASIGDAAFSVIADGGRFSAHGAPSGRFAQPDGAEAARRDIRVTGLDEARFSPERGVELVTAVLATAAAGELHPVIGQRLPLERAAEAHAAIAARTVVGKTLLLV